MREQEGESGEVYRISRTGGAEKHGYLCGSNSCYDRHIKTVQE